jgi:hypothetical protein
MRRPFSDPARREGIVFVMCSTCARTLSTESAARILSSDMYRILQRSHSRVRGRDSSIIVEDRGGGKRPHHLKTSGTEGGLEKVALGKDQG